MQFTFHYILQNILANAIWKLVYFYGSSEQHSSGLVNCINLDILHSISANTPLSLRENSNILYILTFTARKMSKYGVFSDTYFLRIQYKYGKIRTRKNFVFGHFSRSGSYIHPLVSSNTTSIFIKWKFGSFSSGEYLEELGFIWFVTFPFSAWKRSFASIIKPI